MSQVNEKPSFGTIPAGSIRFNTDSAKMEIYNGEQWWNIDSTSPEEQTGGTRGLWAGGNTPTYFNNIQFLKSFKVSPLVVFFFMGRINAIYLGFVFIL